MLQMFVGQEVGLKAPDSPPCSRCTSRSSKTRCCLALRLSCSALTWWLQMKGQQACGVMSRDSRALFSALTKHCACGMSVHAITCA